MQPEATLGGVLGDALAANVRGRLSRFIQDEHSLAIALFRPEHVQQNLEGDWYGEHAGKWLYAAAKAASRTADAGLIESVHRVAGFLVSQQAPDGYLGTYAPERRFMRKQPPGVRTWDGAPGKRTWDIWTHSYLILGLLEVHKHFPSPKYLAAARKIGDLCWHTLTEGRIDITELGNHFGMSATVLMDSAVELYFATREDTYLKLALLILKQANQRPELELLSQALAGVDAAEIGTGKAYQLCWNLVAIAKLHIATGDVQYLAAAQIVWESIRAHHLTLGGGPWGGVALRSREVFNHRSVFSPHGYVETCSTLAWIQLNRVLLNITGDAKYAEEIERSAYNDLLGAQASDGEDWCYYSFPNGKRVHTTYWRCCKSSGAMALEELPSLAYSVRPGNQIAVNLYGQSRVRLPLPDSGSVAIEQITQFPFDGEVRLTINPERPCPFAVLLRIPSWAKRTTIEVNGTPVPQAAIMPGSFISLNRQWKADDAISLHFEMPPVLHRKSSTSVQESRAPDGAPIEQEVMRYDYVAITRGPLVYATTLIDGFKREETLQLPSTPEHELLEVNANTIRMNLGYREPLTFQPYYEAGGRKDGAWRLTWMPVAPARSETQS